MDYKVKLWGKKDPFKPLIYHLIDAGNVCRALIDTPSFSNIVGKLSKKMDCEEKKLIPWLQFIVSLHDIGKCHPDFQGKAEFFFVKELKERGLIANKPYKAYRHEGFGSDWILNLLQSKYGWGKKPARTIRMAIRGLVLQKVNNIKISSDMRWLVEEVYSDSVPPGNLAKVVHVEDKPWKSNKT